MSPGSPMSPGTPMAPRCPRSRRVYRRRLNGSPSSIVASVGGGGSETSLVPIIDIPTVQSTTPSGQESPTSDTDTGFIEIPGASRGLPHIFHRLQRDPSIRKQNESWWTGPPQLRSLSVGPFLTVTGPALVPFQAPKDAFAQLGLEIHLSLSFHAMFDFIADKTLGYMADTWPQMAFEARWEENIGITFYKRTITTEQLMNGSYRAVGDKAVATVNRWTQEKRRRSEWMIVLYRDVTRQNLGDTWFAVLLTGEPLTVGSEGCEEHAGR